MCGRFVQKEAPEYYADYFKAQLMPVFEQRVPQYNVAPTAPVIAVAVHDGVRRLESFRWGLLPFWAKDRRIGAKHINARVETAAMKPAFRDSFSKRRCLIPADGFFEWQVRPQGKLPHYIYSADQRPLALAGLWSMWRDPETDEQIVTCTILTGDPIESVATVHDRMPVILSADMWGTWLDRDLTNVDEVQEMLAGRPDPLMALHPVATLVNKVANNLAENIVPLDSSVGEAQQSLLDLSTSSE
ncbi:MAG: SOS response-associated peptidase [Acidobacteria bacterium]|nr:SOS response-associated peptidase [Acidobacteriota bacterium]MCH8986449.1 SOS response-associated peptidase [Acidobacteriota bacterium]